MSASKRRLSIAPVAAGILLCAAVASGCYNAASQTAQSKPKAGGPVARPQFDGEAALAMIRTQCEFGPRVPGTTAHAKAAEWMKSELEKTADRVVVQEFTYRSLRLRNILGFFNESAPRRVLLCAHWDSRPTADMEIVPAKRRLPIPGANDGASGVAVLLQLAGMFKKQPPPVGVVVAMLDGEDYGDFERDEGVFLGSRYLAANLHAIGRPQYGILLDMVGDRDLRIYREGNSEMRAKHVNDRVFGIAGELGLRRYFPDYVRYTITDDHIALNDAGIPCIDLIDFDYAPWHTLDDTPDKCSATSLRLVGDVVAEVVYRENASRTRSGGER